MKATLRLDTRQVIGRIDERIYGTLVEHMGRCVYHGIYEPTHPTADDMGFRQDVMELIRPLQIPLIRYPGGNFVSGYDWEDGIGPNREPTLDPAWQQLEPNEVGTDEFHEWARRANAGVMMAVNLGTKGPEEAMNLLEYCNLPAGSKYANKRAANGHKEPYKDKVWCLGNEMDGPWQICHRKAEDYAAVARKTASLMKMLDPDVELVACGSSWHGIPTFGSWERTVLKETYDKVSFISMHHYFVNNGKNQPEYLASAEEMGNFISDVVSICDAVGAELKSKKKIHLSFDEWNVQNIIHGWPDNKVDRWSVGPRREEYTPTMEDAVVFGSLLNTLIHHCDRVHVACLAQLVNVCGIIMTENDGACWAQTTYYPFLHASTYGRGAALKEELECPAYFVKKYGDVKYLSTSSVYNEDKGEVTVFASNRNLEEEIQLDVQGLEGYEMIEHIAMSADDLQAANTLQNPDRVVPCCAAVEKGAVTLKKASWNVLRYRKTAE